MQTRLHLHVERAREPGDELGQRRAQNDGVAAHLYQRERSTGPADQQPADDGIRARDGRRIDEDGGGAQPDQGRASTQQAKIDVSIDCVCLHEETRRRLDLTPVGRGERLGSRRDRSTTVALQSPTPGTSRVSSVSTPQACVAATRSAAATGPASSSVPRAFLASAAPALARRARPLRCAQRGAARFRAREAFRRGGRDHDRLRFERASSSGKRFDRRVLAEVRDPPAPSPQGKAERDQPRSCCSPGAQARRARGPAPRSQPLARPSSLPRMSWLAKCSWPPKPRRSPSARRAHADTAARGPRARFRARTPRGRVQRALGSALVEGVQCVAELLRPALEDRRRPRGRRRSPRQGHWAASAAEIPRCRCERTERDPPFIRRGVEAESALGAGRAEQPVPALPGAQELGADACSAAQLSDSAVVRFRLPWPHSTDIEQTFDKRSP